jgi:alpha-L-fucosidase
MNRRTALRLLASVPGSAWALKPPNLFSKTLSQQQGPFQPTHESLSQFQVPEWFRDAKFGIWAHWGPQSAAEYGDWYARNMYIQGSDQYKYHLAHYGHPSKVGFKDIIPTWKAASFNADRLVELYKNAGAKYFVSMGVHHDNFDLWDSKYTRWNSVKMGPKRNVVAEFRRAAQNHGLKFGVSDHLWISYKWFAVSHMSDKEGPMAGVPYDGVEPVNADLYHSYSDPKRITDKLDWNEDGITEAWKAMWSRRITDLIDQAQPDYLYSDGAIPFGERGLQMAAYLYNQSAKRNGGKNEAVYLSKRPEDCAVGTCILDHERGVPSESSGNPWQTDTCVGNWHYMKGIQYKSPKFVIDMLVDVISRNGNLMLNFPLPNSGMLDDDELHILSEITEWMKINSEAIYATRPFNYANPAGARSNAGLEKVKFNEKERKDLTANDIRFTSKGNVLYCFVMGKPEKDSIKVVIAESSAPPIGKITHVELLGFPANLNWRQENNNLTLTVSERLSASHALVFKINGAIQS